jgi:signal transduction histidine kinase
MNSPDPSPDLDRLGERVSQLLAQQQALVEQLRQGQGHFRRLARSVWRVQEDERRRLARELHDGLGKNLTALIRLLDQAVDSAADEARPRLTTARDLAQSTLQDTRALSRLLRPQILDDLGLDAALRWLVRSVGESHGLAIDLDLPDVLPELEGEAAILVFRVVQEALSNAARHAGARHVRVAVETGATLLQLRVSDDGRGCDPACALAAGSEGRSSGLGGMRERVRLFDGELRVHSSPGAGFRLQVDIPFGGGNGRMAP